MSKNRLVEYQKGRKEKALIEVRNFYREHPFSTARECANALGINYQTAQRYVRELKARAKEDMKV